MRKRNWFKTAGVVTFAAQMLGLGGLAHATDKACFPEPTFVYGGDPDYTKLDPNNVTRWTGSSGYGWNSGGPTAISYEGAIGSNTDPADPAHPEIGPKWLLLSFARESTVAQMDSAEGMRVGFNYTYNDPHAGAETVSEIISMFFDSSNHSATWATAPAMCGTTPSTKVCANDPTTAPNTWQAFNPKNIQLLQKINDGTPNPWPLDPAVTNATDWVKNHARLWVFADTSVAPTVYSWRLQLALPLRGGAAPDPTAFWSSPSIYLDNSAFSATPATKNIPPFWLDMMTLATGTSMMAVKHFPDWVDGSGTAPTRDGTYSIPSTTGWATAEVGSPRDKSLLTPGDIQCSGTGVGINASTADKVVWHSDIWNADAGNNTAGIFSDGGQLKYLDAAKHIAPNKMAVQVVNTSTTDYDKSTIKAHFLLAPYGSQAVGSVWAPMTVTGNDFSCGGVTTAGQTSCTPSPIGVTGLIDSAPTTTGPLGLTSGPVEIDQATEWKASPDYLCATQSNDAPPYTWYWQGNNSPGALCELAVYTPNSTSGAVQAAAGLPGHQCIQAVLDSSAAGVQFATKSAFRNMHQASASLHREIASIDTRGLKKIKNQGYHDIYLYVETHNMPYRVDSGYAPPTHDSVMKVYNTFNYRCGGGPDNYARTNGATFVNEGCPNGEWDYTVPAPSERFFEKTMPTLVVHAYADTGETYKVNGRSVPMLTQLTSFGQFVTHDATTEGNVFGWDASLEPVAGTTFQKVGVNTYRIRIPNDGAGQVITHVEPLPSKRPTCSGTVDMNIVQLLNAIAPLVSVSPECAGEVNALIDSLQIECVDLQEVLNKVVALDWGNWTSWVKFLVAQVEAASGCNCN
jgi:hypothetical protein